MSFDDTKILEKRTVPIPTHRPDHLVKNKVMWVAIPLEKIADYEDITLLRFKDKYPVKSRWLVLDGYNKWFRGTVIERDHSQKNRVKIK